MQSRYIFGKYPRGYAVAETAQIPDQDRPAAPLVISGFKRAALITMALGAIFVRQGFVETPVAEAEDIQGSTSITLNDPQYFGKTFTQWTIPDDAVAAEDIQGTASILLNDPQYLGRISLQGVPPPEDVELTQGRRSVYLPRIPYGGKVGIQGIPPDEIAVVEADELHSGRKSVYLPAFPYRGKTRITDVVERADVEVEVEDDHGTISILLNDPPYFGKTRITLPMPDQSLPDGDTNLTFSLPEYLGATRAAFRQPDELAAVEANELHNGIRSIYTRTYPYGGKSFAVSPQPIEIDELLQRRQVFLSTPPYRGKTFITLPPVPEIVVVESDELHKDIRSINTKTYPYQGKTAATFRQPAEIDELLTDRRASYLPNRPYSGDTVAQGAAFTLDETVELKPGIRSVYTPVPPYRGETAAVTRQPEEIDELITGRRSVYAPIPPYDGKTFIALPQLADAVVEEFDERLASRVVNLAKYQPLHQGQSFAGNIERDDVAAAQPDVLTGGHYYPEKKKKKKQSDYWAGMPWQYRNPPPLVVPVPAPQAAPSAKPTMEAAPAKPVVVSQRMVTALARKVQLMKLEALRAQIDRMWQEREDEEALMRLGAFD